MATRIAIQHHTEYQYDRSVSLSPQIIRLRPAPHCRMPIQSYSLKIQPEPHFINWHQDPFGNYLARVIFPKKVNHFAIDVEVLVDMKVINPFDFFLEDYADKYPYTYPDQLKKELLPYFEHPEPGPLVQAWMEKLVPYQNIRTVDFLVALIHMLYEDIQYTLRMEPGIQDPEVTLEKALGSCRDSGWLLVQILRNCGLAARFVSGYLIQLKPDQKPIDGPIGPSEDFTDLHAWAEVYIPGAGWVGLDPTSGLFAGEGHIPLACTPDPVSAAPVSGASDPCEVTLDYANQITRVHEDPRVSKPYLDEQWEAILALGDQIEEELKNGDVRLTMGGEPTFVSVDDMESPQWNSAADGDDKRNKANALVQALKHNFGSRGFVHYGQGKWYPGEALPRWQYALYWRKDGQPMWHKPELLADMNQDYGFDHSHAELFMEELARFLQLNPKNAQPAYEDVFYFLWEEQQLPINVDPLEVNLRDSLERRTLSEHLKTGMNNPKGFVLPLQWNYYKQCWLSCAWEFSRKHMFLTPGNSPLGLRLPLDALPYQVPSQRQHRAERSPFEERGALADYIDAVRERYSQKPQEEIPSELAKPREYVWAEDEEIKPNDPFAQPEEETDDFEPTFRVFTIKTALCIESRQGRLYIFMPPCDHLEHYLDLLAAIEATAEKLQMPVILEGYAPPYDPRVEKMIVSPDPGVIEVNVHPAHNWQEVLRTYDTLFDAAKSCRLGSEKFMVDGKHMGTGGGNHITLGGATSSDSPLLRRPDLLRSLIAYWQNHPGLSYLFSSTFVGPTSQAPRVDEGRMEMLYELEIAFQQIPDPESGQSTPYWLVDRIFRNLLVDLTGNTHRAEFCIDKLYRPDSSSGRLGILELRAFDMPPSKEMCLVQLLLIRNLVAWFWKTPYRNMPVRWGTELHDRFLLHHYVQADMQDVCHQLQLAGYPFDADWLEPFLEFRFPLLGKLQVENIELLIRSAIEPWNVLGEEMSNTGTARFVDSSLERVEVKIRGIHSDRYILLCNGYRVPLRPTGTQGEYVAGIRYKAWAPPSALHPTLPVDVPLVFDIFDTWNGRSMGGCTYFVSHPGGRFYDNYPVNSYAAESRRESRFWGYGHTQGAYRPDQAPLDQWVPGKPKRFVQNHEAPSASVFIPREIPVNPEYPHTLDLRKMKRF